MNRLLILIISAVIFQKRIIKWSIIVISIISFVGCTGTSSKQKEIVASLHESYLMSDFKNVPKIDIHAHITTDGKIMIDEAKANNFRLLAVAVDVVPDYPPMEEQLRVSVKHHNETPDIHEFISAFTLDGWDEPDWVDRTVEKLKRDFKNGALGVKVWKNIGMKAKDKNGNLIMLDDSKFDPVFKFIYDQGKVLMSHTGEPKNCWLPLDKMTVKNDRDYFSQNPEYHMHKHPDMPSYEDQMDARDNMLRKNKNLTFLGAHLAGLEWSVEKIGDFLNEFPNAYVDVAERLSHLQVQSQKDRKKVRDFIIKYQDRILYGTDFQELKSTSPDELRNHIKETWIQDWKYLNTDETMSVSQVDSSFKGLGLPKTVIDKFYYLNAKKLFPNAWKK